MATIHDVMPPFELFQPTSIDDTLSLLERHRRSVWVLAGGLDTFDWPKHRTPAAGRHRPVRHRGAAPLKRCRWPFEFGETRRSPRSQPRGHQREIQAARRRAGLRFAADPQPRHARRQRLAGHPLLVLSHRLDVLSRRRQHLLRRHRRRLTASTRCSTRTAVWR